MSLRHVLQICRPLFFVFQQTSNAPKPISWIEAAAMSRRRGQNIIFLPSLRGPSRISSQRALHAIWLQTRCWSVAPPGRWRLCWWMRCWDHVLWGLQVYSRWCRDLVLGAWFCASSFLHYPSSLMLSCWIFSWWWPASDGAESALSVCIWNLITSAQLLTVPSPYSSVHSRAL